MVFSIPRKLPKLIQRLDYMFFHKLLLLYTTKIIHTVHYVDAKVSNVLAHYSSMAFLPDTGLLC